MTRRFGEAASLPDGLFHPCLTPTFEVSLLRERHDLTGEQYNRLQPLLSGTPPGPGRNADDNRRFPASRSRSPTPAPLRRTSQGASVNRTQPTGRGLPALRPLGKKGRWQAIFEALRETVEKKN